ncbi:hypothetical protein PHPALM_27987 [Phytophthora palmivora]|uniref:Uncharacterized protein n=1 Tax=Phytophthora palmivora TaxID=4796 RepID=A0A2P4XB67_9STRA|nr:hypothetical protein PHPALM_27987 [Phytophthora palmivora]
MRGCPVNNIAIGDVGTSKVTLQSNQNTVVTKTLNADAKYMKVKSCMERIVSVLSYAPQKQ